MKASITVKDTPSPVDLVFATAEVLRTSADVNVSRFPMLKKMAVARGYEARASVHTGEVLASNPSRSDRIFSMFKGASKHATVNVSRLSGTGFRYTLDVTEDSDVKHMLVISDNFDPEGTAGAMILCNMLMQLDIDTWDVKLACNFPECPDGNKNIH